jgi:para-nitrobenzyl esterase
MYRLDWEAPFYGGILKSPHGLDTALVFDNADMKPLMLGTGPAAAVIAAEMSQAWVNFARRGDPSSAGANWPAYDPTRRTTMIFNATQHVVSDPDREARLLLVS